LSVYKNHGSKLTIICKLHGQFTQSPNKHLLGQGCPKCISSKGENLILEFLKNNNIKYIQQYKFDDCKFIKNLFFDFYLPDFNFCIEYDGIQHYHPINWFGGEEKLKLQRQKDEIKNSYCKNKNISLIRFNYNQKNE
jgi:very-short-patch-repair endonuclease